MQFPQFILTTIALSSFAASTPAKHHGVAEQRIIQALESPISPIRDALLSNKVIGDVLDDFEPAYYLDVGYPKSVHVSLGNEIGLKAVKERPRIGIHAVTNSDITLKSLAHTSFTVILTDPDATSRYDPKWSEMCHWIFTNITATTSDDDLFKNGYELVGGHAIDFKTEQAGIAKSGSCLRDGKGKKCVPGELVSYFPPGPPPKTGWHRYVFVLLVGDASRLKAPAERKHWGYGKVRHGIRDWAKENGLEVVSANFFFSKNKKQ